MYNDFHFACIFFFLGVQCRRRVARRSNVKTDKRIFFFQEEEKVRISSFARARAHIVRGKNRRENRTSHTHVHIQPQQTGAQGVCAAVSLIRRRTPSSRFLVRGPYQLVEHRAKELRPNHVRGNTARLGEPQAPAQEGQNGVRVQVLQPHVQQTLFAPHTRTQPSSDGQLPVRDVLQVVQAAGQPATTQVSVEIALNLILSLSLTLSIIHVHYRITLRYGL